VKTGKDAKLTSIQEKIKNAVEKGDELRGKPFILEKVKK
jgi:hypothetical protein